jgi:hypothetical protein
MAEASATEAQAVELLNNAQLATDAPHKVRALAWRHDQHVLALLLPVLLAGAGSCGAGGAHRVDAAATSAFMQGRSPQCIQPPIFPLLPYPPPSSLWDWRLAAPTCPSHLPLR